MKRNILFLLSLCMLLLTCSDGNDPIKEIETKDPFITLKKTNIDFTNEGGSEAISIESNVSWTAKSSASWCTISPTSGNKSTASIKIAADENETYDDRDCTVTIEGEGITKTITVNQGENLGLLITQDRYELSNEESTIKVEVKANVEFDVEINDKWITKIEPRSLTTSEIEFKIAENDTYDNREGSITIKQKDGDMVSTITIFQSQEDAIILSEKEFDLSSAAQSVEVEVKTNIDYEIIIPEDAKDWVSHATTRALRTETVVLDIAENKEYEERTVEVIVKDKKTDLEETVTIKQAANTGIIVNVETPGTLKELLGKDFLTIGMLTIKGEINGADINILREMAGNDRVGKPTKGALYKLDMSEVEIVEGGGAYFYSDYYLYDACFTSNNKMTEFMFYGCNSLTEVVLPNSIDEIKHGALQRCENLESVKMYDSVKRLGNAVFESCKKLVNVNLSDNIEFIGELAFHLCLSLESITLPPKIKSLHRGTFFNCPKLKSIKFPSSLEYIGQSAFTYCESLETIEIPNSVTKIDTYAFGRCENIQKVTFCKGNNSLEIIYDAFNECKKIVEIYCENPMPPRMDSYSSFEQTVYKNCKVYIPKGSHESYYTSKGWRYFENLIEMDF